jgi:hypothetical protein
MSAASIVLIFLLAQTEVGPEDAFRANFAAIHAEAKYRLRVGEAPVESLDRLRSWSSAEISFVERRRSALNVDWACDGVAQRVFCISANPEELEHALMPPTGEKGGMRNLMGGGPIGAASSRPAAKGFEVLWDGEVQLEHRFDGKDVQVHLGDNLGILYTTSGPFLLWATLKYPSQLRVNFPRSVPAIHRASLAGRELVVAVYQDEFEPNGWARLEVWHDPNVGFLPRFARYVVGGGPGGRCREYFLIAARSCASGGFVPTLVYEAIFDTDRPKPVDASEFDSRAPAPVPRGQISMRHLDAVDFNDIKRPAALEKLENVEIIAAVGGVAPLRTKEPLTMERLKVILGPKLNDLAPARMPAIDVAELNELSERPESHWLECCLGIASALAIGSALLWRRRRMSKALMVLTLVGVSQSGCAKGDREVLGLTGAFDKTPILFRRQDTVIPLLLTVRNVGTVPLRLLDMDGNCSCRRVDKSVLPVFVNPGRQFQLHVDIAAHSSSGKEQYVFRAQTDRGGVDLTVPLVLFPRHRVSPESVGSHSLVEDEPWEFTLVHRAVFESGEGPPQLDLRPTPEFVSTRVDAKQGEVAFASQLRYEDSTYQVVLKDKQPGLHKSVLILARPDGQSEYEIPVVWRRVEYLSTAPERALMGARPARVFLRCPDDTIELTRILSAPVGIKAVVSSPREVTVMLADAAPAVIDGFVTVATTAAARPPLRFPVVRYSVTSKD